MSSGDLYSNVIKKIENRLQNDLNDELDELSYYNYTFEIVLIILDVNVFIFIIYILIKGNRIIYHTIVSLIDVEKSNINKAIIQHLGVFINLLRNESINNYNELKKIKYQTEIEKLDRELNDSQNMSTTFNKTNKSMISNTKLIAVNESLIKTINQNKNKVIQVYEIKPSHFEMKDLRVILYFKLLFLLLFILNLFFCILRLYYSLQYNKDISLIYNFLINLNSKFSLVYYSFNQARRGIYTNNTELKNFTDLTNYIYDITLATIHIEESIDKFPLTKKIWTQSQLKLEDKSINLTVLCDGNSFCEEVANNYCYDGISLGIQTILQKFDQFISEVGNVTFEQASFLYLYSYIKTNRISNIETEVEFVINNVQNNFYKSFNEDSNQLRRKIEKVLNVVNSLTIIIGIGFVGFSLLWMIIKVQMLYKVIQFGTCKLQILINNVKYNI